MHRLYLITIHVSIQRHKRGFDLTKIADLKAKIWLKLPNFLPFMHDQITSYMCVCSTHKVTKYHDNDEDDFVVI